MILKDTILKNKLKKFCGEHSTIEDILLFGSAVRGKENPTDLDILILFKNKINKTIEYLIRKELEKKYKNISIISKTKDSALENSFDARESILFESISLISGENLAKKYGFDSIGMFKYGFGGWNKVKRIKFYHALNGRDGKKGILKSFNGIKLSDGIILTPLNKIELMKEFLDYWEIEYKYIPLLIPQRLNKDQILN